jgi:hypothetical protein
MNRFSPKQTLSNFMTAVRVTVDFINKKSFGVTALAILLASAIAAAQSTLRTPAVPEPVLPNAGFRSSTPAEINQIELDKDIRKETKRKRAREKCAAYEADRSNLDKKTDCDDANEDVRDLSPGTVRREEKKDRDDEIQERKCEKRSTEIKEMAEKATKNCAAAGYGQSLALCYGMIAQCNANDPEIGVDEDDVSPGEYCNAAMANKCSGLPAFNDGRDYRAEEKDAERDRKDAKKDVDELMDDDRKAQARQVTEQRELRENQQNEEIAARKAERAIADNIKKTLEGISSDEKAAFEAVQQTYGKMEAEFINMRKQMREAEDMVQQAKDDLQVMCRGSAEKKYQEAEKVRLAALAARKKNVGLGTNVSGSAKRTKAATARARQVDYLAYFSECSNGGSADGRGGVNRIGTAERAKVSAEKFMKEKEQAIETERSRMLEKLKQLEADASNQKSKVVTDANTRLKEMDDERTLIAQQNAARISERKMQNDQESRQLQEKLFTANQELMKTQTKASTAATRNVCQGKQGQRSESRREKVETGFASGHSDVEGLADACEDYSNKKKGNCPEPPRNCAIAIEAARKGTVNGKPVNIYIDGTSPKSRQ